MLNKISEGDYIIDKQNNVYKIDIVNNRLDGLRFSAVKQFVTYHYAHTVSQPQEFKEYRNLGPNPILARLLYSNEVTTNKGE